MGTPTAPSIASPTSYCTNTPSTPTGSTVRGSSGSTSRSNRGPPRHCWTRSWLPELLAHRSGCSPGHVARSLARAVLALDGSWARPGATFRDLRRRRGPRRAREQRGSARRGRRPAHLLHLNAVAARVTSEDTREVAPSRATDRGPVRSCFRAGSAGRRSTRLAAVGSQCLEGLGQPASCVDEGLRTGVEPRSGRRRPSSATSTSRPTDSASISP